MEAISLLAPDVVALQEVTASTAAKCQTLFGANGFFVQHSCGHGASLEENPARRYGEMVASRWAMEPIPDVSCGMPWPERLLSVVIRAPFGEFELHTAYIPPGSSHGWLKIETFEGISKRLSVSSTRPRILCGDFEHSTSGTRRRKSRNLGGMFEARRSGNVEPEKVGAMG